MVTDASPLSTRNFIRQIDGMIVRNNVAVGTEDLSIPGNPVDIPARLYRAPGRGGGSLLVYFHGGGFLFGDLDGFDHLCRLISHDAAVNVLSIDYRLAPEHKAPAGIEDAYTAYSWAVDHAAELGAHSSRVAVGGDSAGGNLAALVSQQAHRKGAAVPALQWLLYPVTELAARTNSRHRFAEGYLLTASDIDWFWGQYLDGSGIDVTDPQLSPLLAEDLAGQPTSLIVTAGFDPLRDEAEAYADALRAAGTRVDLRCMGSQIHGFASFAGLGGAIDAAVNESISALRAHLSRL